MHGTMNVKKLYSLNSWYDFLVYKETCSHWMILIIFHRKQVKYPALAMSPLSHLTSCTPTIYSLRFTSSLATVISDPDLYKLLAFQEPKIIFFSIIWVAPQVWSKSESLWMVRNMVSYYGEELLAPRPTPQAGGPPRISLPRLFIQYIRSYPSYWRLFLNP